MALFYINYDMATPALAYPDTVFTNDAPSAVDENTINSLVCEVTSILNPEVIPLDISPTASVPVRVGAKVTVASSIGSNILSGVVDLYN